jgi:hypothetical protein
VSRPLRGRARRLRARLSGLLSIGYTASVHSIVFPSQLPGAYLKRARELGGEDFVALVGDVHRDGLERGRALGFEVLRSRAVRICDSLLGELERRQAALDTDHAWIVEEPYRGSMPTPIVAAYFGAAHDQIQRWKNLLERMLVDDVPELLLEDGER